MRASSMLPSRLVSDDEPILTTTRCAAAMSGRCCNSSDGIPGEIGGGHRIAFYGEAGTLVLNNTNVDYMRGFELLYAKRPVAALAPIAVDDPADAQYADGRIAPVSRLAKLFFDAIETSGVARPSFAEGYRVQFLIDAAQRSHRSGTAIDVSTRETVA